MFTKDELAVTNLLKEASPWKGNAKEKLEKWQNYLRNLCLVNNISTIPTLTLADNTIESLFHGSYYSLHPHEIHICSFSVKDLLFHFYLYRGNIQGEEEDYKKATEYMVGLFYSVWPKYISDITFSDLDPYTVDILKGLKRAIEINPQYESDINVSGIPNLPKAKPRVWPSQLCPELN